MSFDDDMMKALPESVDISSKICFFTEYFFNFNLASFGIKSIFKRLGSNFKVFFRDYVQ